MIGPLKTMPNALFHFPLFVMQVSISDYLCEGNDLYLLLSVITMTDSSRPNKTERK